MEGLGKYIHGGALSAVVIIVGNGIVYLEIYQTNKITLTSQYDFIPN